tara:strand:- start:224 stop:430 length:207 start_codon:yes stop_codon:yes gene_type:complete
MSKPTTESIIRWIRMVNVKNCKKKNCICAEKLRKLIIRKPLCFQDEKRKEIEIEDFTVKYDKCFNSNT